jgi:hypothetical protein
MPSVTYAPPPNPAAFDQCLKYLNQKILYNLAGSRMTAPNDRLAHWRSDRLRSFSACLDARA